jgi:hypothetical protein
MSRKVGRLEHASKGPLQPLHHALLSLLATVTVEEL